MQKFKDFLNESDMGLYQPGQFKTGSTSFDKLKTGAKFRMYGKSGRVFQKTGPDNYRELIIRYVLDDGATKILPTTQVFPEIRGN